MKILAYYYKELVKQSKMKLKNKKEDLDKLLGTLGASLLGNIFAGWGINWAGEGVVTAGYANKRQDHKNKMGF